MDTTHDTRSPRGRLAHALGSIAASARRAPAEVSAGLALAALFCVCLRGVDGWLIDGGATARIELFARVALSGALFILASFSLSILHEIGSISGEARAGLTAGVGVLIAGYGAVVLDLDAAAELWRWALLFGAGCMGVALTPLARRGDALTLRARLWSFNARLISACASAGSLLGLLFLGLALALVAAQELLGVRVHSDALAYLFGGIAFGLTPWAIASRLPHIAAAAGPRAERTLDDAAAPYLNALVSALALPMTGLYVTILYIYNALFLIGSAEAPKNMMSPLALTASALALGCAVAADELGRHESTRRALSTRASRWVVVAAGGLMPLTAWAILIRIDQYGWTSFRYVRLLAALFISVCAVIAAVHALRGRSQPIAEMMLAAAAACVLGSAGPWGAVEVSRRSQLARVSQAAQDHGRIHEGVLIPCDGACHISDDLRRQLGYVVEEFGVAAIAPMLPAGVTLEEGARPWEVAEALGWNNAVKRIDPYEDSPRGYAYSNGNRSELPHAGTQIEVFSLDPGAEAQVIDGARVRLTTGASADRVVLGEGACQAHGEVSPLTDGERDEMRLEATTRVELRDTDGELVATFIPTHVSQHQLGGRWRTDAMSGSVLLARGPASGCFRARLTE